MSVAIESFAHRDFSKKVLDTIHHSAVVAGSDQVAAGLDKIRKNGAEFEALEARFQLGRDNAAYLRSNIMPLQAAWCRRPPDDVGHCAELLARPQGILRLGRLKESQKKSNDTIKDQLLFVAWLLSVQNPRFAADQSKTCEDAASELQTMQNGRRISKGPDAAGAIVAGFDDATDALPPRRLEQGRQVEVVLSLLMLWHQPCACGRSV